jgi:hypothetical protein
MKYFNDFKLSPLFTKLVILLLTFFLNGFSTEWLASHDIQAAIQAGVKLLPQGLWTAVGIDQLTFNLFKQPEVKAMVAAMQVKKEN